MKRRIYAALILVAFVASCTGAMCRDPKACLFFIAYGHLPVTDAGPE